MKKAICILSVLAILLCAWLVLLWLPALTHEGKPQSETRYGLSEGLQLVEQTFAGKEKRYVVEDGEGNVVFDVPLRGCILDTRFRGGRLRFREQQSGREGYIDRQGIVTLLHEGEASIPEEVATGRTTRFAASGMAPAQQLQGEACALVKVEAPSDFAFSTPLGIVKRKDEVGEIWLYLPQGTKMLTLKHPVWGVLRDYQLGTTLESRMTYELKVDVPRLALAERHDTIVQVRTIIDTVTVTQSRPKEPWSAYALATIGAHDNGPSYGAFFSLMRRHGFFVHVNTLFGSIGKTRGSCAKDGSLGEGTERPYYSGKTAKSHFTITAGATHRLTRQLCLFEGVGYGRSAVAWQLAQSEGGGYVLNDGLTHKGVAGEIGALVAWGRLSVSASAVTIGGKQWQGHLGIGIKLWRTKKMRKNGK